MVITLYYIHIVIRGDVLLFLILKVMIKKITLGGLALVLMAVIFATSAGAATITTVTPSNMQGWAFINDQTDGPGSGMMVNGPATPPLGTGSAQLTATTTTDGQTLQKAAY